MAKQVGRPRLSAERLRLRGSPRAKARAKAEKESDAKPDIKPFSVWLREAALATELTVIELARLSGIRRATLERFMAGPGGLTLAQVDALMLETAEYTPDDRVATKAVNA